MKKKLFISSLVILCTTLTMNLTYAGDIQGGCAAAPCDCRSVGGSFHPVESKWCNYQLCYNQCMSERKGGSSSGGGGAAVGGLYQPFYGLGYSIGQSIGKALFGDPQEEARKRAEAAAMAAEAPRQAEIARQRAEEEARIRAAEEARKRQEQYDRLSSQLQLSEGFDGQGHSLPLMLGDGDDGLRPQGTSFFGLGGSATSVNNDSKVVDLRPRQGYSATAVAPANPGDALPLIMGDQNIVDLSDKKAPYVVDPNVVKDKIQTHEAKPAAMKAKTAVPPVTSSSASNEQQEQKQVRSLQDNQQVMRPVDEISKQRMHAKEEMLQKAAESDRQLDEQNRHNPLSTLKGIPQIDPVGSGEFKAKAEKAQRGWQKALGCAMEEVYARAKSLGPAGIRFSQDLRNEMIRVFNEAGKPVKDSNDVNIVNLTLDRQVLIGSGSAERHFIVEAAVHSKGNGDVDVDVQSYFSESAHKKDKWENLQSFLVLNKFGEVIMGEKSAAVNACLTH